MGWVLHAAFRYQTQPYSPTTPDLPTPPICRSFLAAGTSGGRLGTCWSTWVCLLLTWLPLETAGMTWAWCLAQAWALPWATQCRRSRLLRSWWWRTMIAMAWQRPLSGCCCDGCCRDKLRGCDGGAALVLSFCVNLFALQLLAASFVNF